MRIAFLVLCLTAAGCAESEADRAVARAEYLREIDATHQEKCAADRAAEYALAEEDRTEEAAQYRLFADTSCVNAQLCQQIVGGC